MSNTDSLIKCLEPEKLRLEEPMSAHTTLGVGGKADLFYTTENSGDLVKAVRLARSFKVPVTVIGEGGGVVISSMGIRGLVIKNWSERIQVKTQKSIFDIFRKHEIKKAIVTIDSGVSIRKAIKKLHVLGIVGFNKYVDYSGSIGAMVSGGECQENIVKKSVLDDHGGVKSVGSDKEIGLNIVTDVTYLLPYGKVKSFRKNKNLKKKSVSNVFEEITEEEREVLGYPTRDVSYIVGEILNMKGYKKGKMAVSKNNQNEIVNLGGGKPEEFIKIIEEVKSRAREAIGVELVEKVVRLGFS